jgi:hypothetical protein
MRNPLHLARLLPRLAFLAALPLAGCAPDTGDVLASAVPAQGPMAVGPGGIFFGEGSGMDSTIPLGRIPLGGGALTTLDPSAALSALALDEDSVFYGSETFDLPGPPVWSFAIDRVPQAGGVTETLVTGEGFLIGMSVTGGALVYATMDVDPLRAFDPPELGSGAVFVQPIGEPGTPPAAPVPLAQNLPNPCAITADGANVYWLDCTTQKLVSLPLSAQVGDAPEVLAAGLHVDIDSGPSGPQITTAADRLFWFEGVAVRTMPASGGTPSTLASRSGWTPAQLMADAGGVYWMTAVNYDQSPDDTSDDWQPSLWTANMAGGPVQQVLGPDLAPGAVAMDADFVYWLDTTDSSVRRLAR